ncbi:MAG: hypothetical protein K5656_08230 [Lachnospiraceae bacterium]|nr:hypothetical protein [Lachnospiraceae bacterium]
MLRLDPVYTDHMILQRDKEVRIAGLSAPDIEVKIYLDDENVCLTRANDKGIFKAFMPAHSFDHERHSLKIANDNEEIVLNDIYFGEVFLANGQSNMELELGNSAQADEAFELINEDSSLADNIRFYNVIKAPYDSPEFDKAISENKWITMDDADATHSSAVAFFAALKIYEELNVPVGVVNMVKGGSSVTVWMDLETLAASPDGQYYIDEYDKLVNGKTNEEYFEELEEYNKELDDYYAREKEARDNALAEGRELSGSELNDLIGPYPWPEPAGYCSPYRPAALNEYMFKNVINYTFNCVWYYQGEEDALRHKHYKPLLTKYISYIRKYNDSKDLPVILLQLPVWADKCWEEGHEEGWTEIRKIQAELADELDNVHVIPLIDLGEFDNIHPVDKKTPGTRLANYTLGEIYKLEGYDVLPMKIAFANKEGRVVSVGFDNSYSGFLANVSEEGAEPKLVSAIDADIKGFKLAGEDMAFYDADAFVQGGNIILSSDKVLEPCFISYGWANYITCNLYNKAGIPLMPYCGKVH